MGIPIRELMRRLSSHDVAEYMAEYSIEPWGESRADLRAAIIARETRQVQSRRKVDLADYLIDFDKAEPPSPDALFDKMAAMAEVHNAKLRAERNGNNR